MNLRLHIDKLVLQDRIEKDRPLSGDHSVAAIGSGTVEDVPELTRIKGVGETLNGRFVLEKCLGFGSVGTVYKAFDLRQLEGLSAKPYVAVKTFNISLHADPDLQLSVELAIQKLRQLDHPNIVAVRELHLDGPMAYFTMEFVAGTTLGQIMNAPGFSGMAIDQVLPIVDGIVKALTYAHRQGCLHADLKPSNILITPTSHVKVMDFGIARILQQARKKSELTVFDTSMLRGITRAYVSAELLAGEVTVTRDDIYSLACITYELLTGRHPFDRSLATQARALNLHPDRPKQLNARQWHALTEALSLDRETRTTNLIQFFEALSTGQKPRIQKNGSTALALAGFASVAAMAAFVGFDHYRGAVVTIDAPVRLAASSTAALTPAAKTAVQPLTLASVLPVLANIPCSVLTATVVDDTIAVKGFVSYDYGIAQLNTTLAKIPGTENMKLDVQQISANDCAMVETYGPYWQKSRTANASIQPRSGNSRMTEGEALIVDIKTPAQDAWVHVDYYGLDGGVLHLLPNLRARDNQAPPSYAATIGGARDWIVSAPFGNEMVVLLTTPVPLFSSLRPDKETSAMYLSAVKKQLQEIEKTSGAGRIAVEFLQIQTQPRP